MILEPAPSGYSDIRPGDIGRWPIILADRLLASGRHLVLGDVDGPHRVWMRGASDDMPLAYVLVRDLDIELRHAAVRRLDRRLAGAPPARLPPGFRPSPFQRRRLSLLLDLLDGVLSRDGDHPSSHELARTIVYPGMTIGRGAEWKSSTERRRTQRLIEEAVALMNGGYRALLRG